MIYFHVTYNDIGVQLCSSWRSAGDQWSLITAVDWSMEATQNTAYSIIAYGIQCTAKVQRPWKLSQDVGISLDPLLSSSFHLSSIKSNGVKSSRFFLLAEEKFLPMIINMMNNFQNESRRITITRKLKRKQLIQWTRYHKNTLHWSYSLYKFDCGREVDMASFASFPHFVNGILANFDDLMRGSWMYIEYYDTTVLWMIWP